MKPWHLGIIILTIANSSAQVFRTYTTDDSFLQKINITKNHELVRQCRPDGSIESDAEYHNGRRDGLSHEYYPDGKVKSEINFRNGREHGIARFYYSSGIIQKKIEYNRGRIKEISLFDRQGRQTH